VPIVVQLQRKRKQPALFAYGNATSDEFAFLASSGCALADDNFSRLTDPEPHIPEALNDRAADNWRSLLAIADLRAASGQAGAGRGLPFVGEGHDAASINVELLADIRLAFGDADAVRSATWWPSSLPTRNAPWAE